MRWVASSAAERANFQSFAIELCDVLGVDRPGPATGDPARDRYRFEYPVRFPHADGSTSTGSIDLYRRDAFVMEAKQGSDQQLEEQLALFGGMEIADTQRHRRPRHQELDASPCNAPGARPSATPRRSRSTMAGRRS